MLVTISTLRSFGAEIRLTTRLGGVSRGGYAEWNLASHVGDAPEAVAANRTRLASLLGSHPVWLEQVHGVAVWDADAGRVVGANSEDDADYDRAADGAGDANGVADRPTPQADAAVTATRGRWLGLLTADCLPVVLVRSDGARLAVAHAGWRGLAAGVLAAAAETLAGPFAAWIGPAICGACYEVDEPVVAALAQLGSWIDVGVSRGVRPGHYQVDLAAIASAQLDRLGAVAVVPSGLCTMENRLWYSHRRDGPKTGRFATLAALR